MSVEALTFQAKLIYGRLRDRYEIDLTVQFDGRGRYWTKTAEMSNNQIRNSSFENPTGLIIDTWALWCLITREMSSAFILLHQFLSSNSQF